MVPDEMISASPDETYSEYVGRYHAYVLHEIMREVFDPIIKEAAQFMARWVKKHPTKAMRIAHAQRSRFHRKRPRIGT